MSKTILHNTGRRYSRDGQPIRIVADAEGIVFTDWARMIKGRIDCPDAQGMSDDLLAAYTIAAYDTGDYTITT